MKRKKYYCESCGQEITKEQAEEYNNLCAECYELQEEDNQDLPLYLEEF